MWGGEVVVTVNILLSKKKKGCYGVGFVECPSEVR